MPLSGIPLIEPDDSIFPQTNREESDARPNPHLQMTLGILIKFHAAAVHRRSADCHSVSYRDSGTKARFRVLVLLVCHNQQRLKLRSLRLLVDHSSFNVDEARALKHGFEIRFAEAEPLVGV